MCKIFVCDFWRLFRRLFRAKIFVPLPVGTSSLPPPIGLPPVDADSPLFPKAMELSMNTAFQMFPDSSAARGEDAGKNASTEQIALAQLTKGIHW